jgi:amino acid transporter
MQKQLIATAAGIIAFIIAIIGANFIVRIQFVIFIVLILSILSILVSPFLGFIKDGEPLFSSVPNLSGTGLAIGFWAAFATFFPAVTGIDAGVGMSGNLKTPKKSLSKGTFWAIAVTFVIYVLVAVVFSFVRADAVSSVTKVKTALDIFEGQLIVPLLLFIGVLMATGSSALSYFMTAPRTSWALARDGVFPRRLDFLGKDFFKGGSEPRWAVLVTMFIFMPLIWAGDVAFASLVVGVLFLVVYGWVNLAAFFERISGNPSFRPSSKGHWAISLYGFLICMAVISFFNIAVGVFVILVQLLIFFLLYKYRSNNKLEGVWWGVVFTILAWSLKRINHIIQGTKNWRPVLNVFCFADKPEEAKAVIELGKKVGEYKGLSMLNVLAPPKLEVPLFSIPSSAAFIKNTGENFTAVIKSIVQADLPGGLRANTVMLPMETRLNLIELIEYLIEQGKNVLIYKSGRIIDREDNNIDVWWKGEENGNFMALLSYIIMHGEKTHGNPEPHIRLIRKIGPEENRTKAEEEMRRLLEGARLPGEVLIIEDESKDINTSVREFSFKASLILLGMPGRRAGGLARIFSLDKLFFEKELEKYRDFPPILFVKAASVHDLLE